MNTINLLKMAESLMNRYGTPYALIVTPKDDLRVTPLAVAVRSNENRILEIVRDARN